MAKPHGACACCCAIAPHVRLNCEGRSTGRRPAGGATHVDAVTKREGLCGDGHEEGGRHAGGAAGERNHGGQDSAQFNQNYGVDLDGRASASVHLRQRI
eukprot:scaffold58190_cov64-Phaeocystis_antarctica.AAC.6